jgi:hypothetical protein
MPMREILMVNWRENVEFCYALFVLISAISIFFFFYEPNGLPYASSVVALVVFVEILFGLAAFETDWAIAKWEKFEAGQNQK